VQRVDVARPQRSQVLQRPDRAAQHRRVLAGVGPLVDAEAGGEALELRQAGRQVAVVEEHRLAVPGDQVGGHAGHVVEGDGQEEHGVDVRLLGQQAVERRPPARGDQGLRRPADQALAERLRLPGGGLRVRGGGTPQAAGGIAQGLEQVALALDRVGDGPPPQRLDGRALIGGHDQLDADLVQALEQLPPRRRAAERLLEIKRRGDDQEFHDEFVL